MTSIPTTLITIGKIAMTFALYFAIPLNIFPAREAVFETFEAERSTKNHTIITFLLISTSVVLAISFQAVNSYFGLLGGTAGVLVAGGIPCICYVKLS